jgi:hypothetical protein
VYDPHAALEQHAPHVVLVKTRLPRGDAWWVPSEAAVAVDDRLEWPRERFAVAHEVEHVLAGDEPVDLIFFSRKQEARATRRATRKLIDLSDFVDALLWCRDEVGLGHALQVPPAVVRTWYDALTQQQRQEIDDALWAAEDCLSA